MNIPVKYIQPIESVYIKLEDGTDFHWFNSKLIRKDSQSRDLQIEWINDVPYKVSILESKKEKTQ